MEFYNVNGGSLSKCDNYHSTFKETFKDAFNPNGRMRRRDYFLVNIALFVFFIIIFVAIALVAAMIGLQSYKTEEIVSFMAVVWTIASFYVGICTTIKRLHDADYSSWYILIGFIPVIGLYITYLTFFVWKSGPNKYGSDPRVPYNNQYK